MASFFSSLFQQPRFHNKMGVAAWIEEEFNEDPLYWLLVPYVVGQPLFRLFVRKTDMYNKYKPTCKKIMGAYNLVMSVFSAVCSGLMFYTIATMPNKIYEAGHFDEPTGLFKLLVWFFYVSKYVEFLDTYFLILCDRPVSWLQYIHHVGAVIDMGLLYFSQNDGAWIFVALNGFIHTIMYYYYACAIMKWEFKLMPKNCITIMQLAQFFTGMGVYFAYSFVPGFWADVRKRYAFVFTYYYVGTLVLLFANFYVRSYLMVANKNGAKVSVKAAVAMTAKKVE